MLELGKKQLLKVVKKVDFGVYLGEKAEAGKEEQVLLPAKQVPPGRRGGNRDRKCSCTRIPATA